MVSKVNICAEDEQALTRIREHVQRELQRLGLQVVHIEMELIFAIGGVQRRRRHRAGGGDEGGDKGGYLVAQGTPKEVAKVKKSYTGQFLKRVIK